MVMHARGTVNELTMPAFRPEVRIAIGEHSAEVAGEIRTARIGYEPEAREEIERLFALLREGGRDCAALAEACPGIGPGIEPVLREFDELRLLVESGPAPPTPWRTGAEIAHDVQRMVRRMLLREGPGAFVCALRDGVATRAQLFGYAVEYGWFVAQATAAIAPALATAVTPQRRAMLEDFLVGERGHDAFVRKALAAAGVHAADPWQSRPLPSTFLLAASLSVYAKQHPASFYAALSLFETPQPTFMSLFEENCARVGLPEGFHRPLRAHAELNEREGHGDIGLALMSTLEVVGEEEERLIRRHVGVLVETMRKQEEELVRVYVDDGALAERLPRS
jgi:hypothetical protein